MNFFAGSKMECKQFQEDMSEYLDGRLSRSARAHFKNHLGQCPACRQSFLELRSLALKLRSLPELSAPAGFLVKLRARLDRDGESARDRVSILPKILGRFDSALSAIPLRALSLAAALVLVAGLYWSGQNGGQLPPMGMVSSQHHQDLSEILSSSPEPLPVEFVSTTPRVPSIPVYIETPNELITSIIMQDPEFSQYQLLPHPRGHGALLNTPDYLVEITVDPVEFPLIQAYLEQRGGHLPGSLREARSMFPICIRLLPSPTAPISPR